LENQLLTIEKLFLENQLSIIYTKSKQEELGNMLKLLDIWNQSLQIQKGYIQILLKMKVNLFLILVVGTSIPNEYITAVEKAFYECIEKGPLTNYPVVNVKYVL